MSSTLFEIIKLGGVLFNDLEGLNVVIIKKAT